MAIPPDSLLHDDPISDTLLAPRWQICGVNEHYGIDSEAYAERDDGLQVTMAYRWRVTSEPPAGEDLMPGSYNPIEIITFYLDDWHPGRHYRFQLGRRPVTLTAHPESQARSQCLDRIKGSWWRRRPTRIADHHPTIDQWCDDCGMPNLDAPTGQ